MMYSACMESEKNLQAMKKYIAEGKPITRDQKAQLVEEYNFCNIMRMTEFWEGYNAEVKGATYPNGDNNGTYTERDMHAHQGHMHPTAKTTSNGNKLTEEEMKTWVSKMKNQDGTTGQHWTVEQTTAVMEQHGINKTDISPMCFYVLLNSVYSDHYKTAEKFGLHKDVNFYVSLAHDMIYDADKINIADRLYYTYKNFFKA